MVILLVFLMLFLGLFALFLGGGLLAQGYLYQQPVERLPLRAIGAAILVSGYVTFWMWIDKRAPEKYDTFFNFKGEAKVDFNEFEAVRWSGAGGKLKIENDKPVEIGTTKFKRPPGSKSAFTEEGTGAPFAIRGNAQSGPYIIGAIRVKAETDPEPVQYTVMLKEDKTLTPAPRYVEDKGSRYVELNQMGLMTVPSTSTVVIALLLNFLLVVVWVAAFWPVLRFSLGHSLMFTAVLAVITMLALMPVLFKQNRPKPAPTTNTPPTALVRFANGGHSS